MLKQKKNYKIKKQIQWKHKNFLITNLWLANHKFVIKNIKWRFNKILFDNKKLHPIKKKFRIFKRLNKNKKFNLTVKNYMSEAFNKSFRIYSLLRFFQMRRTKIKWKTYQGDIQQYYGKRYIFRQFKKLINFQLFGKKNKFFVYWLLLGQIIQKRKFNRGFLPYKLTYNLTQKLSNSGLLKNQHYFRKNRDIFLNLNLFLLLTNQLIISENKNFVENKKGIKKPIKFALWTANRLKFSSHQKFLIKIINTKLRKKRKYSFKMNKKNKYFVRKIKMKGLINYFESKTPKSLLIKNKSYFKAILPNFYKFKNFNKKIYNFINWSETQNLYIKRSKRLFFVKNQTRRKFPWFIWSIIKRTLYSTQYLNLYKRLKKPWQIKRNKIYRQFISFNQHRSKRVKLLSFKRGGNRYFRYQLNLFKVILPHYAQIRKYQMYNLWKRFKSLKPHMYGRFGNFKMYLNTSLYSLIQTLNWAPNTMWAQVMIKAGWIYVNNMKTNDNKLQQNNLNMLFPLLLKDRNGILNCIKSTQNPLKKIQANDIIYQNSAVKLFTNQLFFLNSIKWTEKQIPNYIETNSIKNAATIVNSRAIINNSRTRDKISYLRFFIH